MTALLRQPSSHSSPGLLIVVVGDHPVDKTLIVNRVHDPEVHLDIGSAIDPTGSAALVYENRVTHDLKLIRVHHNVLQRHGLQPLTELVGPSEIREATGCDQFDVGVENLDNGVEVASVVGLIGAAQAGDDFFVSSLDLANLNSPAGAGMPPARLLRQPGGFEGIRAISVAARHAKDLAFAKLPDVEEAHLCGDSALPTPSSHPSHTDDVFTVVEELLGIDAKVLPHRIDLFDQAPEAVVSDMDTRVKDVPQRS